MNTAPGTLWSPQLKKPVPICPLPGSVQAQAGWSSEQPGLVEDVPAHGRGVGTG